MLPDDREIKRAVVALCTALTEPAPQSVANTAVAGAAGHKAYEAYVTAVNSNNLAVAAEARALGGAACSLGTVRRS